MLGIYEVGQRNGYFYVSAPGVGTFSTPKTEYLLVAPRS